MRSPSRTKAESEQKPKRIHVPAASDQAEQTAKQAAEEPALGEKDVELVLNIGAAASDPLKQPVNPDEHHQVYHRDDEQEPGRDRRADHPANRQQPGEAVL